MFGFYYFFLVGMMGKRKTFVKTTDMDIEFCLLSNVRILSFDTDSSGFRIYA